MIAVKAQASLHRLTRAIAGHFSYNFFGKSTNTEPTFLLDSSTDHLIFTKNGILNLNLVTFIVDTIKKKKWGFQWVLNQGPLAYKTSYYL